MFVKIPVSRFIPLVFRKSAKSPRANLDCEGKNCETGGFLRNGAKLVIPNRSRTQQANFLSRDTNRAQRRVYLKDMCAAKSPCNIINNV